MTEKPLRRSREEIRQLLLEIGVAILREEGLGSGTDVLTFKKAFDRLDQDKGIRLTNASVIRRVWRNLSEFQADVVVEVVLQGIEDELDLTVGPVAPILANSDLTTPDGRVAAMRELCRVGGAANLETMRRSTNWPLWIGVWGMAASNQPLEHRKRISEALAAGNDQFDQLIGEVYEGLASLLGFRLREQFTLRQFSVAADCLGQGCGLRDRIDDSNMRGILRPTGPGGAQQEWTLFAIGFEALVHQFFELDPEWFPDTANPERRAGDLPPASQPKQAHH